MTQHMPTDTRVPLIGPRNRYLLVSHTPMWLYHKLAAGAALTGVAPETTITDATHTDPTISAGMGAFTDLTKGGYFDHFHHPIIVEAVDNPQAATITVVNNILNTNRAAPAAPFMVGACEVLKAVTATTGAQVGFLVREAIPAR